MNFLPKNINQEYLLSVLREISWDISDLLKSYNQNCSKNKFTKKLNINNKSTGPVTAADIEANKLILKVLKNTFPLADWIFLSEESEESEIHYPLNSDFVWIIDPLDGTKDFIQNTGEYAVHIALTYKNKIVLSLVLAPNNEELWLFVEGKGTWCELRNGKISNYKKPNIKKIDQITVVTSKNHYHDFLSNLLDKLKPAKIVGMGSIGFKITSLMKGETDLYLSYSEEGKSCPKDWDIAAPLGIISGAGGFLTDVDGNSLQILKNKSFRQEGLIIGSMNKNHKKICERIKEIVSF